MEAKKRTEREPDNTRQPDYRLNPQPKADIGYGLGVALVGGYNFIVLLNGSDPNGIKSRGCHPKECSDVRASVPISQRFSRRYAPQNDRSKLKLESFWSAPDLATQGGADSECLLLAVGSIGRRNTSV